MPSGLRFNEVRKTLVGVAVLRRMEGRARNRGAEHGEIKALGWRHWGK